MTVAAANAVAAWPEGNEKSEGQFEIFVMGRGRWTIFLITMFTRKAVVRNDTRKNKTNL